MDNTSATAGQSTFDPTQVCMGCMERKGVVEVCPACSWSDTFSVQPQLYLQPRTVLLDRFIVGRALGFGGCAVTYVGLDLTSREKVVIKEYLPGGLITRAFGNPMALILTPDMQPIFDHGLSLFTREVEMLHSLGHADFLAKPVATFRQNGTAYDVTEYLGGMDFATYMKRHASGIRPEIALRMLLPAVEGLSVVHKAGLLHENISPQNIFLTREAQVKILDFGHARRFLRRQMPKLEFGIKDGFAAEEQYRPDGSVGPWTDMYSLAAVFYFALTGHAPPPAPDRVARDTMPALPGPHTEIHWAVMRAMQPNAAQRFAAMDDFRGALTGLPVPSGGPELPASTRPLNSPVVPAPFPGVSSTSTARLSEPSALPRSGTVRGRRPPLWAWGLLTILLIFGAAGAYKVAVSRDPGAAAPQLAHPALEVRRFEADPPAVPVDGRATLKWEIQGASMVTINGIRVPSQGQTSVKPGGYQLIAFDDSGAKREATRVVGIVAGN